jgi:hypothetical protein
MRQDHELIIDIPVRLPIHREVCTILFHTA